MTSKYVIGLGAVLDAMVDAWSEVSPGEKIVRLEITQGADYQLDLTPIDSIAIGAEVFVACDARFGNFTRLEIFHAAIKRGLHTPSIVSHRAMVSPGIKLGPNSYVGYGAIVGANSVIGYNSVINAGAVVGIGVHIKSSSWLAPGVHLGDEVELGANSTLHSGVLIAPRVKIGRNCEIGIPGHYRQDIPARTTIDPRYDAPIYVHGG